MISKYAYCLMFVFFFLSCSTSRELNGIYIHYKKNTYGDLIFINEDRGEAHSWTNDLWIDNKDFKITQTGDTIILNYTQNNHRNDVLIKRNRGLEKIIEVPASQRFKKVSLKKAKKLIPQFVHHGIFDKY